MSEKSPVETAYENIIKACEAFGHAVAEEAMDWVSQHARAALEDLLEWLEEVFQSYRISGRSVEGTPMWSH